MGFNQGAYAKVWSVEPGESGKYTKVRVSISRKNQETGAYDQEFSGFITMVGEANVAARKDLHPNDRIKIGGTDVTTRYDKERAKEYINYLVFTYEKVVDRPPAQQPAESNPTEGGTDMPAAPAAAVDTDLPF